MVPSRETLKHEETPGGVDLSFVYDFRRFAFSNLSGIILTKYMFCLVASTAPKTLRDTERAGPSKSSGHQKGAQN